MADVSLSYESTTVSVNSSTQAVEKLCLKYHATQIRIGKDFEGQQFTVEMFMGGVPLRVIVQWSGYAKQLHNKHPRTNRATLDQQAERAAWRWTYYWLKLGFEGDAFKFQPKEAAFLAGFTGPDGRTLAEELVPRLDQWQFRGPQMLMLTAGEGSGDA